MYRKDFQKKAGRVQVVSVSFALSREMKERRVVITNNNRLTGISTALTTGRPGFVTTIPVTTL
jgi:hypothetical protein